MKISDLKIIVTGAASGMGRFFALELARQGADVAACDLNEEGLKALETDAAEFSGRLVTFKTNVAVEAEVVALVKGAAEALGYVNGLVNNAGIFRDQLLVKPDKESGTVKRMSLEKWQAVIDVDLTGPFLCTREVAAHMIEKGIKPGVIVGISSISRHGNPGQSNYSAAKAGLVADTKLWGLELARYGIRTGAVAPGFVDTPILQGMKPEMLEKMLTGVPLRRLGSPAEIFQGIKFIIECDYFTGKVLDIDGGMSI